MTSSRLLVLHWTQYLAWRHYITGRSRWAMFSPCILFFRGLRERNEETFFSDLETVGFGFKQKQKEELLYLVARSLPWLNNINNCEGKRTPLLKKIKKSHRNWGKTRENSSEGIFSQWKNLGIVWTCASRKGSNPTCALDGSQAASSSHNAKSVLTATAPTITPLRNDTG